MKEQRFATEAELCAAFTAWVQSRAGEFDFGVQTPKWTCYAETAGWDLLMVGADGTQIGVQAKQRFNLKVLDQALPGSWDAWREVGPDYRAILVPEADSTAENLCSALGLGLFRPRGRISSRDAWEFMPGIDMERWSGGWHYWSPEKRHPLPEFIPDVVAGASGPVQLTKWKIAALRIVARLEIRGHVTRQDFREIGVDIRRWIGPHGWLRPGADPGQFVDSSAMRLAAQHPGVYPQVLEQERAQIGPAQGRLAA